MGTARADGAPCAGCLRVEETELGGRFYVAARPLAAGEPVLEAASEASVVHEAYVSRVCAWCFGQSKQRPLDTLCRECRYVHYCGQGCLEADAAAHAAECTALRRLREQRPKLDREAMTQARLALQVFSHGSGPSEKARARAAATRGLCTGLAAFRARKTWAQRRKRFSAVVSAFGKAVGYDFHWGAEEVEALLGAIDCNGFGIWDCGRDRQLGLSLSVVASLFNHSCAPNVARVSRGRRDTFHLLAPAKEGEPLCISYLDPRVDLAERRAELLENYGFLCRCAACAPASPGAARGAVQICPRHLGYLIPYAGGGPTAGDPQGGWCSVCGTPRPG